ncbi:sulfatase family protein [Halomontanus rarus]|uniref:sulfatase family protein n=1 Tax=Halomontanus rarus TaxID=3034020 RepID=UPI0023E8AF1D|nr:sulfatase [Halovivax sp. TS33]
MRILYIDVDSLRPDHLGCYGYHRDTSPNVDALAADGRQFTNYYASDAPCGPSRTALFLSRFGIHTGVVNHGGLNGDPRRYGRQRGFNYPEKFRSWMTVLAENDIHTASVSPFPSRHDTWQVLEGFVEFHDPRDSHAHAADIYPYAEEWLEDNAADDDWFLHVNFWDPHTEYNTPLEYGNPFEDEPAPEWPDEETIEAHYESYGPHSAFNPESASFDWSGSWNLERMPEEIADREDFKTWVDGYDTGIRFMDDHVGKICDLLREKGVFEETLIVVSADHGEALGEFNVYGDHQCADQATCRVPLIVSGPEVEPGVDDDLHYQVDLAPTVSELVGAEPPAGWDGRSFAPSLTDGEHAGRPSLVVSQGAWACQRAARWDDWLLVRTYHDGGKPAFDDVMLFDVATDPHQTTDLSAERPDVTEKGLSILQRWHDDRMIEAARGENGGNPETPDGVVDPMWDTIREGGPLHARDHLGPYAEYLRSEGREEQAAEIEARYDLDVDA